MWLLLLSVPIFYIVGLVAAIRWLFGLSKDEKAQRRKYLEKAVQELSAVLARSPNQTLAKQLQEYSKELEALRKAEGVIMPPVPLETAQKPIEGAPAVVATETPRILSEETVPTAPPEPKTSWQEDLNQSLGNWYSDNSINLLLYLGAFLIVASASIYVGFAWEQLGGVTKAAVLSLLTLAFFGFGIWFYNVPKIKNAGATFIAIAALLIPFGGLAWHNFVFGPAGYPIGTTWLVTSFFAVAVYILLAAVIRNRFYTYIAGFGGLSTILSIVNVVDLDREFYILGGIFSSFVLLLSTKLFTKIDEETSKNYIIPLSVAAHVIMPISLVFGFLLASSENKLFSFEAVTSAFLATAYYFVAYSFARQVNYLFVSLFLLPVSVFLAGKYIDAGTIGIFIFIQLLCLAYLAISYPIKNGWKKESEAFFTTSNIVQPLSLGIILISAAPFHLFTGQIVAASFIATIFYLAAYYASEEVSFLAVSEMLLAVSLFIFGKWLGLENLHIFNLIASLSLLYLSTIPFITQKESQATSLTAHILMPFALAATVFTAFSVGSIYIWPVVTAGFLASLFYTLAYFVNKQVGWSVVAQVILPFTVFITARWLQFTTLQSFYIIEAVLAAYLILSYLVRKTYIEESKTLVISALAFAAGLFVLAFPNEFSAFHQTIFAAIPAVFGLAAVYISNDDRYLYYNFTAITISVYLYFHNLLGLGDKPYILGLAYLAIAVIFYFCALITTERKTAFNAFIQAAVFHAALASVFTITEPKYFLIGNLVAAGLALDYALRFKKYELIYFSNGLVFIGLWSALRIFDARLAYYPLYFAGLSYAFYFVSQLLPENFKSFYRFTALVGTGATTVVFGLISQSEPGGYYSYSQGRYIKETMFNDLERNALLSSYAATFLYAFDAALIKRAAFGYFASAVGMFTYLWQMKFLGVSETQAYTLPLGLYFMALAYLQRISGKFANRDILDYVGLFFLLFPTLIQSFGDDGAKYALLIGLEGVVVLAFGISLSYRTYIYAGVGAIVVAIFSQTYEFLFSLDRWIITGVAGLAFLFTAIYLLLRRKEEPGK